MRTRGCIIPEYVVWCGECGNWDRQTLKRNDAIGVWKKMGWTNTRKFGWLCPDCTADVEQSKSLPY